MLELRRNSSPTTVNNTITHLNSHKGDGLHHHHHNHHEAASGSTCCGGGAGMTVFTGANAAKSPSEPSASPTVWRKTSHPPLHFNNNETRNRNLQMQLKNRGTKDDWGASLRYDIEEPTSSCLLSDELLPDVPIVRKLSRPSATSSKMEDFDDTCSVTSTGSDRTVLSPIVPMSVFDKFLCLTENLNALISHIIAEAKQNTGSEDYAVFLHDEDNHQLVLFNNETMLMTGRRYPKPSGIVGRVLKTMRAMNIRDVARCPFFNPDIDAQFGVKPKEMLVFPLVDNTIAVIGVIVLYNKEGGFTRHDEKYVKRFSLFVANAVAGAILAKQIQEVETRIHMVEEFKVQGEDVVIEEVEIGRLVNDPLRDWRYFSQNFADFSFPPRSVGENHFHKASMMFFEDLGFSMQYKINKRKLSFLVLRVSVGYRPVPYHNWSHAFAVTHFCWLLLRTEAIRSALNDMERLSLLIACLCHDIDHRGTTNSFQMQSLQKTPLSILYSTEGSVLERHHYAQTVKLLQQEECSILENIPGPDFRTIVNTIRDVILATDISAHLKKQERIKTMIAEGYNPMSFDHRYLLMSLVMTASDLSDQAKNFHNAKLIAQNIYLEFFAQGDLELQLGVKPLEMMDRSNAYVPTVQIDFLYKIGVPVFQLLANVVPEGRTTAEAIEANHLCWMALDDEVRDDKAFGNDLNYLKDDVLERRIYDKVRKQDARAAEIASKRFEPVYANGSVVPQTQDILDHRFDGYDKPYQVPVPAHCPIRQLQQIRTMQKHKAMCIVKYRKLAEEAAQAKLEQENRGDTHDYHNDYHNEYHPDQDKKQESENNEYYQEDDMRDIPSKQESFQNASAENVALLKPSDNPTNGQCCSDSVSPSRRTSRTPRRLWRRARALISSMSSSCASCSPLPSRRQVSEDSESG